MKNQQPNNGIFKLLLFDNSGNVYIDLNFEVNHDVGKNPELADIQLDIIPFSLNVKFDDTQTTTSSLASTLLLNSNNLIGIDIEVEFNSEEKLEPTSISGEISYRNLRIVGSVGDTQMDDSDDSDPNDYIDLDLFIGQDKAGDITFVFEKVVDEDNIYEDYVAYMK